MWFDDLVEGMSFDSPGRTVTEAAVELFSGVSGDFHPLHIDAQYALQTPFGQRIAHGALVLSMAVGLRSQLPFTGEALVAFAEIRSWRFVLPVFIGDTIRVRTEIAELRLTSRPERGVAVQKVQVRNHRDEVVQEGEMVNLLLVRRADVESSSTGHR